MSSTSIQMPLFTPSGAATQTSTPLLTAPTLRQLFNQKNLPTEIRSIIYCHLNTGPKIIHITGKIEKDTTQNRESYVLTFQVSKAHLKQINKMTTKVGILPALDLEESLMGNPENIFFISNGEAILRKFSEMNEEGLGKEFGSNFVPYPIRVLGTRNMKRIAVSAGALINKSDSALLEVNPWRGTFEAAQKILGGFEGLESFFVVLGGDTEEREEGGETEGMSSIFGPKVTEKAGEGRTREVFVNGIQKLMALRGQAVGGTYRHMHEDYARACKAGRLMRDGVEGLGGLETRVVRWG